MYYEPKYPNIYFGIDGEVYTFEDRKYMVVGGAHSVDKIRCLQEGRPFWHDDIPWGDIAGLRNRIVHDYGSVDHKLVYDTLIEDIPVLLESLKNDN